MRKPRPVTTKAEAVAERISTGEGVLIPDADPTRPPDCHGITPGYYDHAGVVALLRFHKGSPDAIQFVADMME